MQKISGLNLGKKRLCSRCGGDRGPRASAALEKQDGHLAKVKVDEMAGLVGHVGAEVAADDAVPRGVVLLVELLLDVGCNILFDIVLLEGLGRAVHGILKRKSRLKSRGTR